MSTLHDTFTTRCSKCDKVTVDADITERMIGESELLRGERTMEDVLDNTKKLKSEFLGQMESRLNAIIDDVMSDLQKTECPERGLLLSNHHVMMQDKRKASVAGKLPEKDFRSRASPLTTLLAVPHIAAIRHIFIAALLLVMIHTILIDIIDSNTVDLGFERLMFSFGKPLTTIRILISVEVLALLVLYPSFYFWATQRLNYDTGTRRMIDYVALGSFALFILSFIYFPAQAVLTSSIGPVSGSVVTMEQGRVLMKMYAFVRSNVPRALHFGLEQKQESKKVEIISTKMEDAEKENREFVVRKGVNGVKNGDLQDENKESGKVLRTWLSWDDENSPCPSYSRYLYYYFAPTLIYKDSYPRTSNIRWKYVCGNFAQVLGSILYANVVVGKAFSIYFGKFGLPDHPMTPAMLCNAVFCLMLPGIFGLVLGFYLLLHAWHNAFAEMLRFGDRLFYKAWWNCTNFSDYYKTWNVLVHDWLYTYVYKDAWESGLGKIHKALPTSLVFLISSGFHEYVIAVSLNFFLPVLFLFFGGFGFALVFVKMAGHKGPIGNIFMWMSLIAGTGIISSAYCAEYFARINCPSTTENPFWDFFIPRSLSCGAIRWSTQNSTSNDR